MRRAALSAATLAAIFLALSPASGSAQKAVFVVRHTEKATGANDAEIPLSEAGQERAQKLAALLRDAGVTAIYSTDTVRTRTTAQPLANALHLETRVYDARDSQGRVSAASLVERLRKEPQGVALVVGHGNTVPALLWALGVPGKIEIGDQEYDNLFLVVPRGAGEPVLLRLKY
jgi:broad specificity phosphatase PhoE